MRTVVEPRLRASLSSRLTPCGQHGGSSEALVAAGSPPTNMGGEDVGGNDIRCAPCYAAAIFSCWERLSSLCTNLAGVDILTSRLPVLALLPLGVRRAV